MGNQHARDRLLEVGGMTKRDSKAAVQITQNFGGATMASAVDSLNKISFVVDDEVIDVEQVNENGDSLWIIAVLVLSRSLAYPIRSAAGK